jgi:predicted AlkP superfamily phosphohydrolase/phosphomutase
MLDTRDFRTDDKDDLLAQIYTMTRQRFKVARYLLDNNRAWDFFMMVEIGVDRIHHGFWKAMDATHRHHDPASPYRNAIFDYYRTVDSEIGTLLDRLDDQTAVFVVSDHGAQKMDGGICINEWLIREGYLVLAGEADPSQGPVRFDQLTVDWRRTSAWGEGGYYGRVFLNVLGREPQGIVTPEEYEPLRDELRGKLEALGDENGQPIGTRCYTPQELYRQVRGVPPDLLVYFGDLAWRSIGTVGWNRVHIFENDTGPDDANHSRTGLFLYYHPQHDFGSQRLDDLHLLQIAPTVLNLLGIGVPPDMQMPAINALLQ